VAGEILEQRIARCVPGRVAVFAGQCGGNEGGADVAVAGPVGDDVEDTAMIAIITFMSWGSSM
jgi:hypothetical protein